MRARLVAILFALIASAALADIWDASPGFEGEPTATDPVSQGDDEIRLMRAETRFRSEVEHHFGSAASDDNGTHRLGSARCFIQNAAPTVTEVADYSNTVGTSASGTATLSANQTNAASFGVTERLGLGRCWIDLDGPDGVAGNSDDNSLWVYLSTGWALAPASLSGADLIRAGAHNLVYHGSFDGQVSSSTTVASGWTNVSTATIAYVTTGVSEGVGLAMQTTAAGGADEGASQTLAGLKASTVYHVVARVRPAAVVGACTIRTTGASVDASDTSLATGAYETLESTFTTDATPTAVVLIIESNADTNVCAWDHVGVYEVSASAVPQPGTVRARATRAAGAGALNCAATYAAGCLAADSGLEVFLTPPGPGYLIAVSARVELEVANANLSCLARLTNGAGTVLDEVIFTSDGNTGGATNATMTPLLYGTAVNPTPGTAINFEVDVRGGAAVTDCDLEDTVINWIEAVMVPTR